MAPGLRHFFTLAVVLAWLTGAVGCAREVEPRSAEASVRPSEMMVRPPEALEVAAPEPEVPATPALPAGPAVTRAAHLLELSRVASRPEDWRCSDEEQRRLATGAGQRAMKAQSDRLAAEAWERDVLLGARVGHDLAYWRRIRWAYTTRGVCRPELFVTEGIVETELMGHPLQAHARLIPRLLAVERRLEASDQGVPSFGWLGAFAARTVRGPFKTSNRLSNHALGMAVDFDAARNPYLSREELRTIEQISGVTLKRASAIPAEERWDSFQQAQVAFMEKVEPWMDDLEARIAQAERKGQGGRKRQLKRQLDRVYASKNLRRAVETGGFMSVPRHFVVEMERAGLTWATDFGPGADLMHFELRRR